jgi:hypothetical protein
VRLPRWLGIAHDENGTIDELPAAPAKADLVRTIGELRTKHDPAVIAVYMHAFQRSMRTAGRVAELSRKTNRSTLAPAAAGA